MKNYPFRLINADQEGAIGDPSLLQQRPFIATDDSFAADAAKFITGKSLETAMNTAIAVGDPLLITGEPGTGKTQAAYYAAYKLGITPVLHFQVKSDSTAGDLLYYFDAVGYFHDANISKQETLDKNKYIQKRALWQAIASTTPRVLLIDEIDKAPRDFPNDLLLELDKMEFTISETQQKITGKKEQRPLVFITSNSERRLPEPFLRRCLYHHISFDIAILKHAVAKRKTQYQALSPEFIQMAMQRFLALREQSLRKPPSTGEFLVWLRVLAITIHAQPKSLDKDLSKLPYLGALLKDHNDIASLS